MYLHSIMYLLIPTCIFVVFDLASGFTFHNVSINSFMQGEISEEEFDLHSIMYLLIRIRSKRRITLLTNLHSIMYLLIQVDRTGTAKVRKDLHSIMYLLIPVLQLPLYHL